MKTTPRRSSFKGAAGDESFILISLAEEHGYTFATEEAQRAWRRRPEGELSESEPDGVSGGAPGLSRGEEWMDSSW